MIFFDIFFLISQQTNIFTFLSNFFFFTTNSDDLRNSPTVDGGDDWRSLRTSGPYGNAGGNGQGGHYHHRPHHQHRVLRSSCTADKDEEEEIVESFDEDDEDEILECGEEGEGENDGEDDEDEDEDEDDDDLFASTLGSDFLDLFAKNGTIGNDEDEDEEDGNGGGGGCSGGGSGSSDFLRGPNGGHGSLGSTVSSSFTTLSPRPASVGPPAGTNLLATGPVNRSPSAARRRATTAAAAQNF